LDSTGPSGICNLLTAIRREKDGFEEDLSPEDIPRVFENDNLTLERYH
jgi:hypothetical protein